MNIGIMTYHSACNYGAYLQACALCSWLNEKKDINAEIIDFHMNKEEKYYSKKSWSFKRRFLHNKEYKFSMDVYKGFERANYAIGLTKKSSDSCVSDDLDVFSAFVKNKYDVIIAGSDEIWNTNSFRGFPTPYWLPGDYGVKKVSYAASSRVDFSRLSDDKAEQIRMFLEDFQLLGVRDELTFKNIKWAVGDNKLQRCCDPSFLVDLDVTDIYTKYPKSFDSGKKTIVVMTENNEIANKIKKHCKDRYNLFSVYHWHSGYENISNITPEEWLKLICNADLVLASYFHAICFSIMKHTNFLALETPSKSSKLLDLLENSVFYKNFISNAVDADWTFKIEDLLDNPIPNENYDKFTEFQKEKAETFLRRLRGIV